MPEPTPARMATGMLPEVDPLAVSGDIVAAGSSTVFPLAEAIAERFRMKGMAGTSRSTASAVGGGLERFCVAGETDIANASRAIKDGEIESCKAIGRDAIEFRVGTDALAVVVSPANDWIGEEGVTLAELARSSRRTTKNWSDVNPEWPAEPIKRFSPGTDSGTFDYFMEEVMNPVVLKDPTADAGKGEEALLGAANLQLSEDDNVLVQGVAGSPYAIGYFGYRLLHGEPDKIHRPGDRGCCAVGGGGGSGQYPLARPLFIYSDAKIMADKPQVADFINFFLTNVNEEIGKVGYFPASDAALEEARAKWTGWLVRATGPKWLAKKHRRKRLLPRGSLTRT